MTFFHMTEDPRELLSRLFIPFDFYTVEVKTEHFTYTYRSTHITTLK